MKPTGVIGFLGMPGTGKSYLMKMRFWDSPRVVVYNFASGFGPPKTCKANQNPLPGFTFVYTVPDLCAVMQQAGRGRLRVCFCPVDAVVLPNGKKKNKREIFDDVCRNVNKCARAHGETVFAVDEVWNGCTASWSPDNFNASFCQWRHYDICLMWTAQRPADTDMALRSMSNEVYAGRLLLKADISSLEKCGFSGDLMAMLPKLHNRQFVHRSENGEWRLEK